MLEQFKLIWYSYNHISLYWKVKSHQGQNRKNTNALLDCFLSNGISSKLWVRSCHRSENKSFLIIYSDPNYCPYRLQYTFVILFAMFKIGHSNTRICSELSYRIFQINRNITDGQSERFALILRCRLRLRTKFPLARRFSGVSFCENLQFLSTSIRNYYRNSNIQIYCRIYGKVHQCSSMVNNQQFLFIMKVQVHT